MSTQFSRKLSDDKTEAVLALLKIGKIPSEIALELEVHPKEIKRIIKLPMKLHKEIEPIHLGSKKQAYYNSDEILLPKYHWSLLSILEKEFYLNYKENKQQVQTIGNPGDLDKIPNKILNFKKQTKWK